MGCAHLGGSSLWALAQFLWCRPTVHGRGEAGGGEEGAGASLSSPRGPPGISQGENESPKPLVRAYVT